MQPAYANVPAPPAPAPPPPEAPPALRPWYVTAPYGLSMAFGAAAAVLGFAPKVTAADALMVVGGLALLLTPLAAAAGALRCLFPGERRERLAAALAFAAVLSLPLFALLAAVLKAVTHHRGLGGVTFAVVGLGLGSFALAVGARLARWASRRPAVLPWARRFLVTVAFVVALATVVGAGWLRAGRLDVLLVVLAPVLGARAPLIRSVWVGRLSWAVGAVCSLVALGLALGRPLGTAVGQDVPLVDGVLAGARLVAGKQTLSEGADGQSAPPGGAAEGAAGGSP
ncbi:MAG TPA: hypothetical protein VFS00_17580 [Polyangiaceae bacterium]|nr:hypothetical protein [Polyangiaceae bacterium]